MAFKGKKTEIKEFRINDEITLNNSDKVRIVNDEIGTQVISFAEAKKLSDKMDLDLVEINGTVSPPILKLISYDKMMYEMKKNAKKNKNNVKPLKEIDLSVNIARNDLETKARKAKEFIADGSKVKVVLTMRGRELSRRDENKKCLLEFISLIEDVAVVEAMPKDEGNRTIVTFKKK